jgi:polysaccharide pyruvyl transferase WcaK-like protein
MLRVTIELLKRHGVKDISLLSYGRRDRWPGLEPSLPLVHAPSGGLIDKSLFERQLARYQMACIIGADTLDGHYSEERSLLLWSIASRVAEDGHTSIVLGSSLNDRPTPAIQECIRALPREVSVLARDPLSRDRLQLLLKRQVELVADLAFLLEPASSETSEVVRRAEAWLRDSHADVRLVLGWNLNLTGAATAGLTEVDLVEASIQALDALASQFEKVLLLPIPHDYRRGQADAETLKRLLQRVEGNYPCASWLLELQLGAAEAKGLALLCDIVVTGRMHLAIAAIGGGVPAIMFAYQGKVAGLYATLDLTPLVIDLASPEFTDSVTQALLSVSADLDGWREKLGSKLPLVREDAAAHGAILAQALRQQTED